MSGLKPSTVTVFHGHTHAAISLMQSCPEATEIGNVVRKYLVENEYVPEHNECIGGRWRKVWAHWKPKYKYYRYDHRAQKLYVPIAYARFIIATARQLGMNVEEKVINDYPLRKMSIKMNPKFHDKPEQVEPISKLSDSSTTGMKGLNLQTGKGKTYCAVKSAVNLGYATVIIVPGLVEQWIDDIVEYTTAKKGFHVHKIEGFKSLAVLAENPNYKPDIFVASTRTMQMFCNNTDGYDVLPWNYKQFFAVYGIGTKIVDECHKQFNANTVMDLKSNVPYNIYLSATFNQTSSQARNIFNKIFPESMRIGGEVYDKYVTVYFYHFYGQVQDKRCNRSKGYMHSLYETDLLRSNNKFNSHVSELFIPLINQYYINRYQKGHKCLVFCSTIEFVNRLTERLRAEYPQLRISSYTAGSSRSVLNDSDLVVSTIGKSSTGLDWKGLRFCLNTVSVRSPVLTSQMLGRLRKINGEQLIYADICDDNVKAQVRHAVDRKQDLERMAAKFQVFNGMNDIFTT